MTKLSLLKNSFGTAAAALGALAVMGTASGAAAQALQGGQCYDRQHVLNALQQEGQVELVSAVAPIPERPRNIFTSNANGSLGYNIEQGTGSVTGQLCVRARYTDVQVNGNIDGPTPAWALIGENTAHNQWLENSREKTAERVLLGARVLRNDEKGNLVRGGFMMVMRGRSAVSTHTSAGGITVSFNNGEIRPTVLLVNVEPHPRNYSWFAQRGVNVASLNPSSR